MKNWAITIVCLFLSGCSTYGQRPGRAVASNLTVRTSTSSAKEYPIKYSKITGTFLRFDSQQRISTGIQYSSQETKLSEHKLVIRTFEKGRQIETEMVLSGPDMLDFTSKSNDPRLPVITGHYFNSDYEDCVLTAVLTDKNLKINGTVTKLDDDHALSVKTLADISTGKIVGLMQEQVELISKDEFESATAAK